VVEGILEGRLQDDTYLTEREERETKGLRERDASSSAVETKEALEASVEGRREECGGSWGVERVL